jgi:lysylphosphatidylglycerol synthetase-like protein (DUF2156 family)
MVGRRRSRNLRQAVQRAHNFGITAEIVAEQIDERLSVDMITATRQAGAQRLSLAFAAFPEIFNDKERGALSSFFYAAIHLGDPLITLESLYR